MAAAKREFALDIFELLGKLSANDLHIWETLTDEQKKAFSALVTMRWMSGTSNQGQIVALNELVNTRVFNLAGHEELMMKLLAICGPGQWKRYAWTPSKSGKKTRKLATKAIMDFYQLPEHRAKENLHRLDMSDLVEMAEALGWQKDEIAALKKEKE